MSSGVDSEYRNKLKHHDGDAVGARGRHMLVRRIVFVSTWATLIGAIVGLALPGHERLGGFVLHRLTPVCTTLITLFTIVQTLLTRQVKWLAHREAAEKLKVACMRYRFRISPYDSHDPGVDDATLRRNIREISQRAESLKPTEPIGPLKFSHYRYLVRTRSELGEDLQDTPYSGTLPRFPLSAKKTGEQPPDDPSGEEAVLRGRLGNQQQWYIRKARFNAALYLLCQLVIVLISSAIALNRFLLTIELWQVALGTACILACIGWRDAFHFGPLYINYLRAFASLENLRRDYVNRAGKFEGIDHPDRVPLLAQRVEEILEAEFEYWLQAGHRG